MRSGIREARLSLPVGVIRREIADIELEHHRNPSAMLCGAINEMRKALRVKEFNGEFSTRIQGWEGRGILVTIEASVNGTERSNP